jgi:hypothetical protein
MIFLLSLGQNVLTSLLSLFIGTVGPVVLFRESRVDRTFLCRFLGVDMTTCRYCLPALRRAKPDWVFLEEMSMPSSRRARTK